MIWLDLFMEKERFVSSIRASQLTPEGISTNGALDATIPDIIVGIVVGYEFCFSGGKVICDFVDGCSLLATHPASSEELDVMKHIVFARYTHYPFRHFVEEGK